MHALRVALAVLLSSAEMGRAQDAPPRTTNTSVDSALAREQQRRIASFDSVVKSVDTDSAFKLWHVMLTAPDIRKAQLAMMCEYARLSAASPSP